MAAQHEAARTRSISIISKYQKRERNAVYILVYDIVLSVFYSSSCWYGGVEEKTAA